MRKPSTLQNKTEKQSKDVLVKLNIDQFGEIRNIQYWTYSTEYRKIIQCSTIWQFGTNTFSHFERIHCEVWENTEYKNTQLIASKGVDGIKNGEEIDPHAWQSFRNIRVYIQNITRTLIALRPQYADEFTQRHKQYLNALNTLEKRLLEKIASIPSSQRIVVTSHDAFGYLGREFDIRFLAPLGLSLEVEASAQDVSIVIDQIRKHKVQALFVENINNPRLLQRIAAEANVGIGGRLYSDALSEVNGPADTYLNMMQHNVESLISAFKLNSL